MSEEIELKFILRFRGKKLTGDEEMNHVHKRDSTAQGRVLHCWACGTVWVQEDTDE